MKKTIALLLLISITLLAFSGCHSLNIYSVEVTGSKDTLMRPIMPFYKAGDIVKIKAHPVTDVSLHVFVNGEEIPMSHYDSDYWGFEFVMPGEDITIHLTYNQFYGKEDYTFDDLCSLNFLDADITKVSIKTVDYTEKYSFIETRYSSNKDDIDSFKAIINQNLKKASNNEASNASTGKEYSFYYNTESNKERKESLEFNDNFFTWNDFSSWQAFKFEDENYCLPTIEEADLITYSFIYDGRSSDVKRYDDEKFSIDYFNIDIVEFVHYEGEIPEGELKFYLDSRYGKINLFSATIFELNGEYYEIVSGADEWAYTRYQLGTKR